MRVIAIEPDMKVGNLGDQHRVAARRMFKTFFPPTVRLGTSPSIAGLAALVNFALRPN